MSHSTPPDTPTLLLATAGAAALAGVVLLTAVLPAEFGIDPLGVGQALGLLDLADASDSPLESHSNGHRRDRVEFILEPYQSVEYKYQLGAGDTLIFSWQAEGELLFDMHADPEGSEGDEDVESFSKGTAASDSGVYRAPFTGIHGWFWENRSFNEVVLRLDSAGYYDSSVVFRDGGSYERNLDPAL